MKRLINYLEALTVTQGRLAGEPFKALPWQRKFVTRAFKRGTQSAALSVARGNGKTALLSGIAAATLDGPLMVPRSETVIVASSFEQGRDAQRSQRRARLIDFGCRLHQQIAFDALQNLPVPIDHKKPRAVDYILGS